MKPHKSIKLIIDNILINQISSSTMPGGKTCNDCDKKISLQGSGLGPLPLLCRLCMNEKWKPHYDEDLEAVKNPHYLPGSGDPNRILEYLRYNPFKKVNRDINPIVFNDPAADWNIVNKSFPVIERIKGKKSERMRQWRKDNALTKNIAIEEAGDMTVLETEEFKQSYNSFRYLYEKCCDAKNDLINSSKISVVPNSTGPDINLYAEAERKYRVSEVTILLNKHGVLTPLGNTPGNLMVVKVNSIEEFELEATNARNDLGGPSVVYIYMQICRATTKDSACSLEKACQEFCTSRNIPNHTEAERYRQGNPGTKPSSVTVGIAINALKSVREGIFRFNLSYADFFYKRMTTNYDWAIDSKLWIHEMGKSTIRKRKYMSDRYYQKKEDEKKQTDSDNDTTKTTEETDSDNDTNN